MRDPADEVRRVGRPAQNEIRQQRLEVVVADFGDCVSVRDLCQPTQQKKPTKRKVGFLDAAERRFQLIAARCLLIRSR